MPEVAPSLPPADLPVDLRRIELLCARLRPEEGVELEAISWAIGKRPLGEGWDNVLWPIGTLQGRPRVLRVARRRASRALLGREVTVLRRLRGLGTSLPMGLPRVIATAEDAVVVEWIEGATVAETDRAVQAEAAEDLAAMLATIHSGPAPEVGRNPVRGVPLETRADAFRADLDRARLLTADARRAERRWRAGLAAEPWQGRELLLHGTPPRQIPATRSRPRYRLATPRVATPRAISALLLHVPAALLRPTAVARPGSGSRTTWEALRPAPPKEPHGLSPSSWPIPTLTSWGGSVAASSRTAPRDPEPPPPDTATGHPDDAPALGRQPSSAPATART